MEPDPRFSRLDAAFWAQVKLVSLQLGYSQRRRSGGSMRMRRYSYEEVLNMCQIRGLDPSYLGTPDLPTGELALLIEYLNHRTEAVERRIEPLLMTRAQTEAAFAQLLHNGPGRTPWPVGRSRSITVRRPSDHMSRTYL
jgi:hypothetical protein